MPDTPDRVDTAAGTGGTVAGTDTVAMEGMAATVGTVETQLMGGGDNRPMQYMPPIALGRG
jgi:hypothetical protein